MAEILKKKEVLIFIGITVLFLILRLPGFNHLYHQDEYKWPIIVNPALTEPGGIPHPPVGEFVYREFGKVVGYDNFRLIPLIFSFANIFLILYLSKTVFDTKTGLWTAFLFAVSFYSVLASLMVDTDGAVMPFFLLIAAIAYFKLKKVNFQYSNWFFVLILSIILGFLTKTSFIIAIGAFVIDFAVDKNVFSDKKIFFRYLGYGLGLGIVLILVLLISKIIFPFFNLQSSVLYWEHFFKLSDRGWLQTFIQFAKSLLYTSPLLILPVFLISKETFNKTRFFFIFIALGLFFYLFLFDFSIGALDRYLQFLIIPLCIISGAVITKITSPQPLPKGEGRRGGVLILIVLFLFIFSLQFLNHFIPPLYPKTEWLHKVVSFEWNFLFPFTGGSGPTGFYVSFLFMALVWICSFTFAARKFLIGVLFLGILYNAVFIEEYLLGKINGSAPSLVYAATDFIKNDSSIKKVVVYNDIGAYEIQKTGKYARRLYATPQSEQLYKVFFENFSGHVLYINIPRIGENNFYSNYLNSCKNIYKKQDKHITAEILNCGK